MADTSTMTISENAWLLQFTNVTTTMQSHLLATTNKFVDKDIRVTAIANAGQYKAVGTSVTNSSVTPKISNLHATATSTYGFITTLPSGVTLTNGTNYLLIDPDATATAWSVTPQAQITTAGWLDTGSKNGTVTSQTPSIKGGTSYYIPILGGGQADGVSLAGGGISTTTYTNEVTTAPNVEVTSGGTFKTKTGYGVTTTKPDGTDGTNYLTINGAGSVKTTGKALATVKMTRAAVTYSNDAGIIAAHSGTRGLASTNSGNQTKEVDITPEITDSFAPLYIPIRTVSQGTTTVDSDTKEVTRGKASWSAGAIAAGSINAATFSAKATSGVTYVDISDTTAAPVLVSGDFLYINKGYTDNLKISLAKLVPNGASATLSGAYILKGYSAYDNAGALIAGTIETYDGTYT